MLYADVLTFQEFASNESLPLSQIQAAVLEFLQGRDDVVLFGALAVNAYVREPRSTQIVDLLSTCAQQVAEEMRLHLREKFHIEVRTREGEAGVGFRIYQVISEGNRYLVDVRSVEDLPNANFIENILVLAPAEVIVGKVTAFHFRQSKPKAGIDRRDLSLLLLRFPELKEKIEPALREVGADDDVLTTWATIACETLVDDDENDEDLNY